MTGGSLVTTAKFGPWASAFSCMPVRGVFERLWTHFTLWLLTAVVSPDVVVSGSSLG